MLDVAMSLEERYRVLLPPDRKHLDRSERLKQNVTAHASGSEPDVELEDEKDESDNELEVDELAAIAASNKQGEQVKLKIKFTPSREQSLIPAKSASISAAAASWKKKKTATKNVPVRGSRSQSLAHSPSISSPFSTFLGEPTASTPSPVQPTHPEIATLDVTTAPEATTFQKKSSKQVAEPLSRTRPHKRPKDTDGAAIDNDGDVEMTPLPPIQPNGITPSAPKVNRPPSPIQTSISAPPVRAKSSHPRAHSHSSPKLLHSSYGSATATNMERTSCLLMVSAMRTASAPLARKTQRHVTAFGVKVPDTLDDIREFELPWWIFPEDDEEQVQGTGPPQMHPENMMLSGTGPVVAGGGGRHVKGQNRADGGDVEFRRFLDDTIPSYTQQDSEKVAASALLQL
jgi:hypothetical protein